MLQYGYLEDFISELRSNGKYVFVAELMKFLSRDYYVGLLNAAAFYGAAHQQPQGFSIVTTKPSLRGILTKALTINFNIKKEWSKEDIIQKKVETGYINVSSPELTALDVVSRNAKIMLNYLGCL